jgi:hypothetical protein
MKKLVLYLVLFLSLETLAVTTFETTCKQDDCFRFGWITTGPDYYRLDTVCKNFDCNEYGWTSLANDFSTYEVVCKKRSCFNEGWNSLQRVNAWTFEDEVTCKDQQCLISGWTVKTGYDLMGGNATCHQDDCSKYGGYSFWRGRDSHTSCYQGDCYHKGWRLYIE